MVHLIETAEQATPAWFTAVMQANGHDVRVTDVTATPVGTGQMAENSRFHLRYDGETDAPATLVGKFPSQNEASRAAGAHGAGLHGPRWNDESLFEIEGMTRLDDTDSIDFLAMLVAQMMPGFIERYRAHLSEDDVAILTMFADRIGTWLTRDLPGFALVHGDYRLDNLLFSPANAAGAPPVSAVDWQTITVGAPVNDLSYFLGNGLLPPERREAEHDLVIAYHQELVGLGVDISLDTVVEEYRWGSFHGPLITVLGSMMVVQTDRGDEMFMAMISRSLEQIRDLNAADLLAS